MGKIAKTRIFYGWWVVIIIFMLGVYGGATIWYGFTAFFNPLIDEFAWSYTAISVAASIRGVETGIMEAVIGFMVDRFSIRGIVLGGSILVGLGWLLLSQVNSLVIFYVSFIVICIGGSGIGMTITLTLAARWFKKRHGLVTGLAMAGFGAGGIAVPGIVSMLDIVGFRSVFIIFGITAFIIGVIAAYFVRDWPRDVGSVPDGISSYRDENIPEKALEENKAVIKEDISSQGDYTFRKAISRPAFWIITLAFLASVFSWLVVITYIMPYLEHIGYSRSDASFVAMMLPLISIGGRLFTGWISDRVACRKLFILALAGQLIGIILFYYSEMFFALILFVIFLGINFGSANVLRPIAMKRYYGTTYIGSILGLSATLGQFFSLTGPIIAGWILDATGSYSLVWIITAILFLVSIPLLGMLKQPK